MKLCFKKSVLVIPDTNLINELLARRTLVKQRYLFLLQLYLGIVFNLTGLLLRVPTDSDCTVEGKNHAFV